VRAEEPEILAFDVSEGDVDNHFFRRGPVAAHLLVSSGRAPRLIVAFPAGNCGAGLWFASAGAPVDLAVRGPVVPVERDDGMRGVSASLVSSASLLRVRGAVLGSVRALREYGSRGAVPAELGHSVELGSSVVLERATACGKHRVALLITVRAGGSVTVDLKGRVVLAAAGSGKSLELEITALTDEPPLTPIAARDLLVESAQPDPGDAAGMRALQTLAFLAYEEKLLAGSYRFLTYFGRDTLLTLRLLLPALQPRVIEAALGSVLDRLGPEGDVAHEEDIGDWAAVRRLRGEVAQGEVRDPIYDYQMIDDDFLLAPVAVAYLLDHPAGRERGRALLARRMPGGGMYGEALARNLARVLRAATPFALDPCARTLVSLKEGHPVGEWRDSVEGLGFGRTPFNVNAVLVPAALEAAARLYESDLGLGDAAAARCAGRLAAAWQQAAALFRVEVPVDVARAQLRSCAESMGVDPGPALECVQGPVGFYALALDAQGAPIPVMHSDDAFALLFASPSSEDLEEAAGRLCRPFPAGLRTPVGVVVANAAFAPAHRHLFSRSHYHGAVVWSWKQAMLAAGLRRQLGRADLPESTRLALQQAEESLWEVIRAAEAMRASELWTWAVEDGWFKLVPFGAEGAHQDESNAAQLWSTTYLSLPAGPVP